MIQIIQHPLSAQQENDDVADDNTQKQPNQMQSNIEQEQSAQYSPTITVATAASLLNILDIGTSSSQHGEYHDGNDLFGFCCCQIPIEIWN